VEGNRNLAIDSADRKSLSRIRSHLIALMALFGWIALVALVSLATLVALASLATGVSLAALVSDRRSQMTPCASIASATNSNPAMLAPAT
jgi:hypothetical protein